MKRLRFYKEASGSWYIDLPEWEGDKSDLLMVCGADTLLDIISQKGTEVEIDVSLEEFENATPLYLVRNGAGEGGGYYFIRNLGSSSLNMEIWLCDVTTFVFGFIPDKIFLRPVADR